MRFGNLRLSAILTRLKPSLSWAFLLLGLLGYAALLIQTQTGRPFLIATELNPKKIRVPSDGQAKRQDFWYHLPVAEPIPPRIAKGIIILEEGTHRFRHTDRKIAVQLEGGGLFTVREKKLWFSTPDNTDPRTNGRRYVALLPWTPKLLEMLLPVLVATVGFGALVGSVDGRRSLCRAASLPSRMNMATGVLVLAVIFVLRTWPRLLSPAVWCEDGTHCLVGFVKLGLRDLMSPVNGYYLLIPKALSAISFSLSPMAYPALNTLFACALTLFVCVWVARTPLYLQGAWLLAAACLLVPTDPEVFGPGLYTLWWSSVLLLSLVFWKPGHSWLAARGAVLILAGLSTPLTFAVLPFLWVRAIAFWKQRDERILALLATACAIIQVAPA